MGTEPYPKAFYIYGYSREACNFASDLHTTLIRHFPNEFGAGFRPTFERPEEEAFKPEEEVELEGEARDEAYWENWYAERFPTQPWSRLTLNNKFTVRAFSHADSPEAIFRGMLVREGILPKVEVATKDKGEKCLYVAQSVKDEDKGEGWANYRDFFYGRVSWLGVLVDGRLNIRQARRVVADVKAGRI